VEGVDPSCSDEGGNKKDGAVRSNDLNKRHVRIGGEVYEIKTKKNKLSGHRELIVHDIPVATIYSSSEQVRGNVGNISIGSRKTTTVEYNIKGIEQLIGKEKAAKFQTDKQPVKDIWNAKNCFMNDFHKAVTVNASTVEEFDKDEE